MDDSIWLVSEEENVGVKSLGAMTGRGLGFPFDALMANNFSALKIHQWNSYILLIPIN